MPRPARRNKASQPAATLAAEADVSHFHNPRAWVALIVLATAVAFAPVLAADFTNWDDNATLSNNPRLNPPSVENLLWYWHPRHPYMDLYVPVTYTVWSAVAAVAYVPTPDAAGVHLNPWLFHGLNLALHALSALACFALLRRLVRHVPAAGVGSLLFALHPVQVESVAWASGTKDVLFGLFSLVALWQYVRFAQHDDDDPTSRTRWPHYAVATAALVLAMHSKPTAVITPVIAAALDFLVLRRPLPKVAAGVLPWLALAVPVIIEGRYAQPAHDPRAFVVPLAQRPLIAADALAFYLYKLVLPASLGPLYDRAPETVIAAGWHRLTWLAPAAVFAVAMALLRRARWVLAALAVFWLAVLPVLGLVPFDFQKYSTVSDHYLYLAMLGPALAAAFGLARLRADRRWPWAVWAVVLAVLGCRSFFQARHWRDSITLFEHAVGVNPRSATAYANLALAYIAAGRPEDALRADLAAVAVRPDSPEAHGNAAASLAHFGRFDEAEAHYHEALRLDPNSQAARFGLAKLRRERELRVGATQPANAGRP